MEVVPVKLARRALARAAGLPPATHDEVVVDRDLEAKMADGTVLLADHWYPAAATRLPVVLIRSPYGRRQLGLLARVYAERGYQVLVQSCRGTFGSGGPFEPFRHEQEDGRATLEWIRQQDWFGGSVATFGPSYLGVVQWAVAAGAPEYLKAMALQVTAANVRDAVVYPGGTFALETGAVWCQQVEHQEGRPTSVVMALLASGRGLAKASRTLPLRDADKKAIGYRIAYFQDWLIHDRPGDPWWDSVNYTDDVGDMPPCSHVGGWFDPFLPAQVGDYVRLRQAGRDARLLIGPWTHTSPGVSLAAIRDSLDLFAAHLGNGKADRHPAPTAARVRIYVTGSKRWVDLPEWPPPADLQRWYLHGGGILSTRAGSTRSDTYLYDPADPTPSLSGASLYVVRAGSRNQRNRERRTDVLVYTSHVLSSDMTVAGPLAADVWVRSTRPFFDVFVRLCDVSPSGKSVNVSDGIIRVEPERPAAGADRVARVRVPMWPLARTFKAGHRVRVQISSAAHPLYARNTGSGEPLDRAVTLFPSVQEIFHDSERPSSIALPVSSI
jgi:putative CocE/NonD family hydrolase